MSAGSVEHRRRYCCSSLHDGHRTSIDTMPPTPFQPTHETPFKSSLSSSQQTRKRHDGQATVSAPHPSSEWPVAIEAGQLDAQYWTYLAEGGKNLLLRYTGPDVYPFVHADGRRIALRMTKTPRQALAESSSSAVAGQEADKKARKEEESEDGMAIDALEWQRTVLQPDLAQLNESSLLPPLMRAMESSAGQCRPFLRLIASKIEGLRPLQRRRVSGIDEEQPIDILITEDLSAPVPDRPCLILEVKPKCGFLPQQEQLHPALGAYKASVSRFRMHAVLKAESNLSLEQFKGLYDPLDLYSGQPDRIEKAASALYGAWSRAEGNNLRIFVDGQKVDQNVQEGDQGATSSAQALARALWPEAAYDLQQVVSRILADDRVQAVLARLRVLQERYDPLDVEGVDKLCAKEQGKGLAQMDDEPDLTLKEYQSLVQKLHAGQKIEQSLSAREAIAGLLLSASYKDCSLFIRASPAPASAANPSAGPEITVHLVDLDPKPTSKLPYLLSIDQQVAQTFAHWAQHNGLRA